MSKLTPMQEKFAKNVGLKDMTYSAAYRDAYNAENYKPESVNCEASKLMSNPTILQRVDELKVKREKAIIKEAVYDYKKHMEELEVINKKALKAADESPTSLNTALKATELKGKVSELYNFKQDMDITSGGERVQMPTIMVNNDPLSFEVGEQLDEE